MIREIFKFEKELSNLYILDFNLFRFKNAFLPVFDWDWDIPSKFALTTIKFL